MSRPAILAEDITVRFRPYVEKKPTLRRSISNLRSQKAELVTALEDVSFQVEKGEAFGVIGHNGAGKSTLLRVVARTLRPDSGRVVIDGRLSTLLQLGVGFNAQLSGRRNIYLGGLATGMTTKQIDRVADDIVEYAELDDAIDRPVNTYSSGMFSRLAFSVSMHMDPDILLLDEVLSVGDESFREKTTESMNELLQRSGTIVYVSHSLGTITDFCDRVLWLDHGRVKQIGPADEVVEAYSADNKEKRRQRQFETLEKKTMARIERADKESGWQAEIHVVFSDVARHRLRGAFRGNEELLADQGLVVVGFGLGDQELYRAVSDVLIDEDEEAVETLRPMLKQLRDEGKHRLLVIGADLEKAGSEGYLLLRELLANGPDSVSVSAYLPDPLRRAHDEYAREVRTQQKGFGFLDFVGEKFQLGYRRFLTTIDQALGSDLTNIFDYEVHRENFIEHFQSEVLELDPDLIHLRDPESFPRTLTLGELDSMSRINRVLRGRKEAQKVVRAIVRMFPEHDDEHAFPQSGIKLLVERFEEELEWIGDHFPQLGALSVNAVEAPVLTDDRFDNELSDLERVAMAALAVRLGGQGQGQGKGKGKEQ